MRAVWFEHKGPAAEVLKYGEMDDPHPGPGEVRIRVTHSGINPGDAKKRAGTYDRTMPYPRIIPHTDGAGVVDEVGPGVPGKWRNKQAWCSYAQTYRPFGTAAEFTIVPAAHVAELPDGFDLAQGACFGIPGITGHRAVFADGPVKGQTVLVRGGAGAVGRAAVALARRGGARVLATVTAPGQRDEVRAAGAEEVFVVGDDLVDHVKETAPGGVDRIVEVAFSDNIAQDVEMLAIGGTVVSYSSRDDEPSIPFRQMVFSNITARMIGYDDFPAEVISAAMTDVAAAAAAGDLSYPIGAVFPLPESASAHQAVEDRTVVGRVLVSIA